MNVMLKTTIAGAALAPTLAPAMAAPALQVAPDHPDAVLLSLAGDVERYAAELERIDAEIDAAEIRKASIEVAYPDALLVLSGDFTICGLPIGGEKCEDGKRRHLDVDGLREADPHGYSIHHDDGTVEFVANEREQQRADEILAAYDAWQAACGQIEEEVGLVAAYEAADEAFDRYANARDQAIDLKASTPAGLAAKARIFRASCKRENSGRDKDETLGQCVQSSQQIAMSAMFDMIDDIP